jgi:CSLREA domain-containing protein
MTVARTNDRTVFFSVSTFPIFAALMLAFVAGDSLFAQRQAGLATGFQHGQPLSLLTSGLRAGVSAEQLRPLAMATADFDGDGVGDLAIGYGLDKGGAIALLRGNLDALAPQSRESWLAAGQGRYSSPFLAKDDMIPVPVQPDLLRAADLYGDGRQDLVFAAQNGHELYILRGDGKGNFVLQPPVSVAGAITALAAYRPGDSGASDAVIVGVKTASGAAVALFRAAGSGLQLRASYALPGVASVIEVANLDARFTPDAAIVADGQLLVLHGSNALNGAAQLETLPLNGVQAVAAGEFLFDRHAQLQLSALTSDGSVHILAHEGLDSRPYTHAELVAARKDSAAHHGAPTLAQKAGNTGGQPWIEIESTPGIAPVDASNPPILLRSKSLGSGAEALVVVNSSQQEIVTLRHQGATAVANANAARLGQALVLHSALSSSGSVAALSLPVSPQGADGLVVLPRFSIHPEITLPASGNTFYVNSTPDSADTNDALRCTQGSAEICSLRDAVTYANQDAALNIAGSKADTIMLPAGTYNLTLNVGVVDGNGSLTSHLDITGPMTIIGVAGGTIIDAKLNDKVFSIDPDLDSAFSTTLENLTLQNGLNSNNPAIYPSTDSYGGAIDWEAFGTGNLTITNCTIQNSKIQWGPGGGIFASNALGGTGLLTITNSTITGNATPEVGGGVNVGDAAAAVISASTFSSNSAKLNVNSSDPGAVGQGGGLFIYPRNTSATPQSTITGGSFSNNDSDSDGGGIYTNTGLSITGGASFAGNVSGGSGGGIFHDTANSGVAETTTISAANFAGNTAATTGGGITVGSQTAASGNLLTVANSRFYGNLSTGGTNGLSVGEPGQSGAGGVTAIENWWGCNAGPQTASDGCDQAHLYDAGTGSLTTSPNIVLTLGVSPGSVAVGTAIQLTAAVNTDSNLGSVSGSPGALLGLDIALSATVGSFTSPPSSTAINATGEAAESITPTSPGAGTASATLDAQTVTANFTAEAPALALGVSPVGVFTQGSTGQWAIQLSNSGNTATSGTVSVMDVLPAGYTSVSYTGAGWSCAGMGTNIATCTSTQAVTGGGNYSLLTITVNVPANSPVSVSNTVSAWGGGDPIHDSSSNAVTGTSTVTVIQVPATINILAGNNQSAVIGHAFATNLQVSVLDAGSVPIPNASVTFTAPAAGASGTFSNSTNTISVLSNPSGTANAGPFTANSTIGGPYQVTASAGVGLSTNFSLTNTGVPNFVVTTPADDAGNAANCTPQTTPGTGTDSFCSLRDALLAAASTGAAHISFSSTVFLAGNTAAQNTITLTNGTLNIPSNTTITGATSGTGATLKNLVTVDGNNNVTVFTVAGSLIATEIDNLTIAHGNAPQGGGISNEGTLKITNTTFSANSTTVAGGGIFNTGPLTVVNCAFIGNSATAPGGGIFNNGVLTVIDSTFSANSSGLQGGGIYDGGAATVTNSTFSGNTAPGGGAGIFGDLDSTLANDLSSDSAGGPFINMGGNEIAGLDGVLPASISLAPLGNYGGPTQTMMQLPGSAGICAGTLANVPGGVTTDQRGFSRTNASYSGYTPPSAACVDAGAVQTNYALSFTTEPPASVQSGAAFTASNAPRITLTESAATASFVSGPVSVSSSSGVLSAASIPLASGVGSFSGLSITSPTTIPSDQLSATLALNPTLNLTATSSSFQVAILNLSPPAGALPGGMVGVFYTQTFSATGGSAPYTFSLTGTLPTGMSLNLSSGVLSGTPTAICNCTFTITVTDTVPNTLNQTYTLTIAQGTPSLTWAQPSAITYGTSLSGVLNAALSPAWSSVAGAIAYTATPTGGVATPVTAATVLGAGSYTLKATFTPTDKADYATATANVTLSIGKATLTVTAASPSITYGQTLPAYTATYSNFVNGDGTGVLSGAPSLTTTPAAPSAAGTYPITAAIGTLSAANYTFTFVNGTLTIGKATLTVTAGSPTITYGQTLPAYTATYGGFVNGDGTGVLSGAPSLTTTPAAPSAAGTYPITAAIGTLSAANYTFTFVNGALTIGKAALTVTAASPTITYGQTLPAYTATYSGFKNGDGTGVLSGAPSLTTTPTAPSTVGTYPITAAIGTLSAANYSFTFVNGTLTIGKATLTVTAPSPTITYGQTLPAYTANYSGFENGDSAAALSGAPSLTTNPTAPSAVGTYPITAAAGTLSAANYTFAFVNGTLTIGKATLTVTASSLSIAYGQALPAYTASYSGFVNGDSASVLSGSPALTTNPIAPSAAGQYPITVTVGTLSAANYTFALVNGTLTIIQSPSAVSVTSNINPVFVLNPVTFTASVSFGSASIPGGDASFGSSLFTKGSAGVRRGARPMNLAPVGPAGPTGTVTFLDGATPICTSVALGAYDSTTGMATATCTTSSLVVASHSITVVYNGDGNFLTSTSLPLTEVVVDFTISAVNATVTVLPGAEGKFTFTVSPSSGATTFPAEITLAVSGLPAGATAVLSPTTIAAGAATTTVTLTIQTEIVSSAAQPAAGGDLASRPNRFRLASLSLALLLLPFAGRLRKAAKRFNRSIPMLLLLAITLAAAVGLSGCGSKIGFFGQPQQTYTVTMTGTSGALSHSATVNLRVE